MFDPVPHSAQSTSRVSWLTLRSPGPPVTFTFTQIGSPLSLSPALRKNRFGRSAGWEEEPPAIPEWATAFDGMDVGADETDAGAAGTAAMTGALAAGKAAGETHVSSVADPLAGARDWQMAEMPSQLGPAKGKDFDGANCMGPCIVTADEIDVRAHAPHSARTLLI